jgi:hypothetical protein
MLSLRLPTSVIGVALLRFAVPSDTVPDRGSRDIACGYGAKAWSVGTSGRVGASATRKAWWAMGLLEVADGDEAGGKARISS